MKKWHVTASITGSKYLGIFEADTKEEAEQKAMAHGEGPSLCHQCADECSDAEITETFADEVSDGGAR